MTYAAYTPIRDSAKPKSALWRLILGMVTAVLLTFLWLGIVILGLSVAAGVHPMRAVEFAFGGEADQPSRAILFLMVVAGLGFGTVIAAAVWHGRDRASLFGRGPVVLRDFVVAAAVTIFLASALTGVQLFLDTESDLVRNLDASVWLMWLPVALLAIAFQTGAEEVFFRGYIQGQLAARFRSPIIWLCVPAILFGFAHFAPGLPSYNAWLYVGFAAFFGVLAGDLTARTGSLGAAWGWHFANNSFAILVIATEGSISGLGYWRTNSSLLEPIVLTPFLLFDLLIVLGVWFLIRRALRV